MAYPSKFDQLEQVYGKPIDEILVEKLNELGDIAKVARNLDVSYDSTFAKVKDLGIEKDPPHWRKQEQEAQRERI